MATRFPGHIVVRLERGWSFDRPGRRFVHADERVFRPGEDLPKFTRILWQVPELASKSHRSEAEDRLARGLQLVPPRGTPLDEMLDRVRRWPCIEKAWVAPGVRAASPRRGR